MESFHRDNNSTREKVIALDPSPLDNWYSAFFLKQFHNKGKQVWMSEPQKLGQRKLNIT